MTLKEVKEKLNTTLKEVKERLNSVVSYNGFGYTLKEIILYRDKKSDDFKYSCTLLDKNKNSVLRVPVEEVDFA